MAANVYRNRAKNSNVLDGIGWEDWLMVIENLMCRERQLRAALKPVAERDVAKTIGDLRVVHLSYDAVLDTITDEGQDYYVALDVLSLGRPVAEKVAQCSECGERFDSGEVHECPAEKVDGGRDAGHWRDYSQP